MRLGLGCWHGKPLWNQIGGVKAFEDKTTRLVDVRAPGDMRAREGK
jgi:hypothetical protein